jgi:hypothetical protein
LDEEIEVSIYCPYSEAGRCSCENGPIGLFTSPNPIASL